MAQAAPGVADGIGRLPRPIVLDGKMGDPGGSRRPVTRISRCATPRPANRPRSAPRCIWRYDAATLYVAIRSFDDEPKKIRALAATGDDAWKDDWAVLCLNTYDDALNSLFFLVTPGNIRSSGALDAGNEPRLGWI